MLHRSLRVRRLGCDLEKFRTIKDYRLSRLNRGCRLRHPLYLCILSYGYSVIEGLPLIGRLIWMYRDEIIQSKSTEIKEILEDIDAIFHRNINSTMHFDSITDRANISLQ